MVHDVVERDNLDSLGKAWIKIFGFGLSLLKSLNRCFVLKNLSLNTKSQIDGMVQIFPLNNQESLDNVILILLYHLMTK